MSIDVVVVVVIMSGPVMKVLVVMGQLVTHPLMVIMHMLELERHSNHMTKTCREVAVVRVYRHELMILLALRRSNWRRYRSRRHLVNLYRE
jgi:hypothetical protein